MAGRGFNLPPLGGRGIGDHELEQPDVQMNLGGPFLRELPRRPGVNEIEGDSRAGFLERSQIACALNHATDVPEDRRATCALLRVPESARKIALRADEDTSVQPDGFEVFVAFLQEETRHGGNPRILPNWDTSDDAARKRDE